MCKLFFARFVQGNIRRPQTCKFNSLGDFESVGGCSREIWIIIKSSHPLFLEEEMKCRRELKFLIVGRKICMNRADHPDDHFTCNFCEGPVPDNTPPLEKKEISEMSKK